MLYFVFGDLESGHQHSSGSGTANSGSEASTKPVQDATHQAMAVLGIALIMGGEEIEAQIFYPFGKETSVYRF